MRSTFVRTAAAAALLALAGATAAMAPVGVDTISTPTGPEGVTAPAATATSGFLTTPNPISSLTCPGEVIWRAAPRARPPRPNRPPPPQRPTTPPPIPRDAIGIVGRITDATTGQLLLDAAVTVVGTSFSTLTNLSGYYSLPTVPSGDHTVKVVILGYATQERQVTVTAGRATVADFALEVAPINLDEIVATGVAGEVQRREAESQASAGLSSHAGLSAEAGNSASGTAATPSRTPASSRTTSGSSAPPRSPPSRSTSTGPRTPTSGASSRTGSVRPSTRCASRR